MVAYAGIVALTIRLTLSQSVREMRSNISQRAVRNCYGHGLLIGQRRVRVNRTSQKMHRHKCRHDDRQ